MKKIYYTTCSYAAPHTGALIDYMISDLTAGNDIYWVYCNEIMSSCFINNSANHAMCQGCKIINKFLVKKYGNNINFLPMPYVNSEIDASILNYDNVGQLRNLEYRGVKIGMGILSYYISKSRDMVTDMTSEKKAYFDYLVLDCARTIDAIYALIERIKPDTICIHNGRFYENRAFYDIAKLIGLGFESVEVVGGFGDKYKPTKFIGDLPHSLKLFTEMAMYVWNASKDSDEDKIAKGADFYEKRRKGIPAADKVYISNQIKNLLPNNVDYNKKNIVIFNSSPDEIAAIGDDWDEGILFESQYDAVKYMLRHCDRNCYFYLRVHPNLLNVNQPFHTDLYKLKEEFDNISIIGPDSKISSYALLDLADTVVVFGSTMGVEACYWGKPTILLGHAWYDYFDVYYRPKDRYELIKLLQTELVAKNKLDAIKYAYYIMDRTYQVKQDQKVNIDVRTYHVLGLRIQYSPYLKVCGSVWLSKIIQVFFTNICKIFYKDKNPLPSFE